MIQYDAAFYITLPVTYYITSMWVLNDITAAGVVFTSELQGLTARWEELGTGRCFHFTHGTEMAKQWQNNGKAMYLQLVLIWDGWTVDIYRRTCICSTLIVGVFDGPRGHAVRLLGWGVDEEPGLEPMVPHSFSNEYIFVWYLQW